MADGPQHHVQIMEDQTRFDLNRAIAAWREELSARPGISTEEVRELETHLRCGVDALQRDGCGESDAFARACRRLGSTSEIAAEFAKENPLRTWRGKVFWMAFAGLAIWLCREAIGLAQLLQGLLEPSTAATVVFVGALYLLPALVIAQVAMGRARGVVSLVEWVLRSRFRLLATTMLLLFLFQAGDVWILRDHPRATNIFGTANYREFLNWTFVLRGCVQQLTWLGPLLGLLVWLLPAVRNESSSRPRERVFWIANGALLLTVIASLTAPLWKLSYLVSPFLFPNFEPGYLFLQRFFFPAILASLPCVLGIAAVRGRLDSLTERFQRRLQSRRRIAMTAAIAVLASQLVSFMTWNFGGNFPLVLVYVLFWPVVWIVFITWLAPLLSEPVRKTAG